jgi:hypothetical protein
MSTENACQPTVAEVFKKDTQARAHVLHRQEHRCGYQEVVVAAAELE